MLALGCDHGGYELMQEVKKHLENRGIAHIKFLDMYILFYVAVDNFAEDGMASLQITDNLLKMADISIDEAYKYSLENLESQVEIKTMEEIKSIVDVMFGDHNDPELTRILSQFIKPKEDETR